MAKNYFHPIRPKFLQGSVYLPEGTRLFFSFLTHKPQEQLPLSPETGRYRCSNSGQLQTLLSTCSALILQYELRLTASDNLKENFTTFVIHVKDVNDNPPVFERSNYQTQITEEDDRTLPKRILGVIMFFIPQVDAF